MEMALYSPSINPMLIQSPYDSDQVERTFGGAAEVKVGC